MNNVLVDQSLGLKRRVQADDNRIDESYRVGVEVEACLLDDKALPVNASPLIKELSSKYKVDSEYGKCQFEVITDPMSMHNLSNINSFFQEFLDFLCLKVKKVYKNRNVIPVFLGGNPSPLIFKRKFITRKERYHNLYNLQKKIPDIEIEGQKYKARDIATAIQGFHVHLQGKNPVHTANMFNYILNLIPTAILLGSNSKLFAGKLFSLYSPRIYLYEHSEQHNSGFPAIPRYLDKIEDYIDYITSRTGSNAKDYFGLEKDRHDDLRIRLNSEYYRVETRIMSVQPTPREMVAMIEFFIGFLYKAMVDKKPLRPLASIREERNAVIHSGYNAKTHFDVVETAKSQIHTAKQGLAELGLGSEFIKILETRINNKTSPALYVSRLWESKYNGDVSQTVSEIIQHVWEKTKENMPLL
ncbi:MAG: glutamate-cysteine ligase family protein [Candidatus Nitrosocosmicus sp.]